MRNLMMVGLMSIVVSILCAPAAASVVFTGDGSPTLVGFEYMPGSGGSCVEPDGYTFDTPAGNMTQDTTYANDISPRWGLSATLAAAELVRANGWFLETRVNTLQSHGGDGGGWGVCFGGGDELGGCYVTFETTAIIMNYSNDWATEATTVEEGYHTVRISMAPGGTEVDLDIDGTPIGSYACIDEVTVTALFGDGSGARLGEAYWDYFGVNGVPSGGDPIPGDANLDDIVNDADASILAAHWQQSGMGWGDGDFNGDNVVNDADASILAAHWQETQEGVAPVPEPATIVLLTGGLLCLLAWRRRR